jgi:hypothetical protein
VVSVNITNVEQRIRRIEKSIDAMAHLIQFPKHQIEEIHPKCPKGHGA